MSAHVLAVDKGPCHTNMASLLLVGTGCLSMTAKNALKMHVSGSEFCQSSAPQCKVAPSLCYVPG